MVQSVKGFKVDYELPSSFCRYDDLKPEYKLLKINRRFNWLKDVHLAYDNQLIKFVDDINSYNNTPIIIDGCNEAVSHYLNDLGFECIRIGKEAILDLAAEHIQKKSLKELIRRGSRKKYFSEITFSEDNMDRLKTFIKETSHGDEPQLKYLFNNTFLPFNRLFVSKDKNDFWYGAILLSYKEKDFVQTELMLRRKHASVGVMEALIEQIYNHLKIEGIHFWSLGAVPFTIYNQSIFTKEGIINFVGRRLRFAYNYKGLFQFKAKFNPVWIDYYFCFKSGLTLLLLFSILIKTNLSALTAHKFKQKLLSAL